MGFSCVVSRLRVSDRKEKSDARTEGAGTGATNLFNFNDLFNDLGHLHLDDL